MPFQEDITQRLISGTCGSQFGGSQTGKGSSKPIAKLRAELHTLYFREIAHLLNIMLVDFGSSSTKFKSVVVNDTSNVTPARVLWCVISEAKERGERQHIHTKSWWWCFPVNSQHPRVLTFKQQHSSKLPTQFQVHFSDVGFLLRLKNRRCTAHLGGALYVTHSRRGIRQDGFTVVVAGSVAEEFYMMYIQQYQCGTRQPK